MRLTLVVMAGLVLSGCAMPVIDRLAIRDWEPSVKVSEDARVTAKASKKEVRLIYRKKF